MNIFKSIENALIKYNVKHIIKSEYCRYKIIIEYINGEVEERTYNNYYDGSKNDILEYFIKPKNNMLIFNGKAIPSQTNIKEISVEALDRLYGYYYADAFSSWLPRWITKEQLIENNKRHRKEIEYMNKNEV